MESCLILDIKEGRVLPRDGLNELVPWDVIKFGNRTLNLRDTDKGRHIVCFGDNGEYIYTQFLKDGNSYLLGPERSQRIHTAGKEIRCKNTREERDNDSTETRFVSDGKIRLTRKHQKKSINSYACETEYALSDYAYVIVLTQNVFKGRIQVIINKVIINRPDPLILNNVLKCLSLASADSNKTKILD